MHSKTEESNIKVEFLSSLSLPSSYTFDKKGPIVKETIFNKKVYQQLDKQSSIFKTCISRSAIYAISTVYYLESMNTLDKINFESIFLFMKYKKYFETIKEEIHFQNNKTTITNYINDFKKSLKLKEFISSKNFGIFGSSTNYKSISKQYFDNLDKFLLQYKRNPLEIHPGYIFNHKNDMFILSPHSIRYLLKTLSKADKEQVTKDLTRMSIFINKKQFNYESYSQNSDLIYKKFLIDLKNEKITNQNALNFIESYAHQGALVAGWAFIFIKAVSEENYMHSFSNNDSGCLSIHFDYIQENAIRITGLLPFKIRNCETGNTIGFSKNIALTFQNIFIFPKNRITNSVIVSDSKIGLLNASLSNNQDISILKLFKKTIEEKNKNCSLSREIITNNTDFKVL
ncbi:hypothetical protein [Fluviispira vulneris]|uniref:hypothetical protein n=1 Tax=Fluviispira vulneris TaxID=2763012 RepID=UPI001645C84E|nr:hypothetical protein [Fluviispira vulneris]